MASIRAMGPLNKEGKLIFKGLTYPQVERLVQLLGEDSKKVKRDCGGATSKKE